MTTTTARRGDDRGAILVHVAFALLALMAFASFTVDFGVMWASRRQAQNAADAGAWPAPSPSKTTRATRIPSRLRRA